VDRRARRFYNNRARRRILVAATRFRFVVVFLLFAITVVNYIDRSAIAFSIPLMEHPLGLSKTAEGAILGAFGIGYAVTTLLGGIAVDRWGARIVLGIAALLWSFSIGLTGMATGFLMLYIARVLLGVAEGPNFPAMAGAIKNWLPPDRQATAFGDGLVAVPIALAVGGPLVTQLLGVMNWRWTFGVLFVGSLIWAPLWWWLFRNRPTESSHVNAEERALIQAKRGDTASHADAGAHLRELRTLLTNPTLLANYWAFFVFGFYLFFFMGWLPTFLYRRYHLDLGAVGAFTVLPWAAAAVALWAVSRWSDYLYRTTGRLRLARSYLIAGSQFIAALAVIPVAFGTSLPAAIAWISLAVAASMSANAAYFAVNTDVIPQRAATGLGIMDFTFALAGFIAPSLTGWVLNIRGSFTDGFLLMAALAASSVLLVLVFHNPDRDRLGPGITQA
jgi:ACS family hexuronate transporter-like MFS transporter